MNDLLPSTRKKQAISFIIKSMGNSISQHHLSRWNEDNLFMIADTFRKKNLDILVYDLRAYTLPSWALPLAHNRHPFDELNAQTIETLIGLMLESPDRVGNLTYIIRERFNILPNRPTSFVFLEAHINATEAQGAFLNKMVSLGFEPDNFHKLQPSCYKNNLTISFSVERADVSRIKYLRDHVATQVSTAQALIQSNSHISGFIESEIYDSKWLKNYSPFKSVSSAGLSHFPYTSKTFSVVNIPNTQFEVTQPEINLESRKRIDVHVKLPTPIREEQMRGAASLEMSSLREKLLSSGFYEIVSESGNAIFTAQFLNARQGLEVFKELDRFGSQFGGFIDLSAEICIDFWRKKIVSLDSYRFAEVSPVLIPN